MGWVIGGVIIALWIAWRVWLRWDYQGRHNWYWDSDMFAPAGTVYYHRASQTWYTAPRRALPCPRQFDRRSNPLDHEYEYERREVPPKFVNVPHEVEY